MTPRETRELKALHLKAIHKSKDLDDKEWYRLNRLETKKVKRLSLDECSSICSKCFSG